MTKQHEAKPAIGVPTSANPRRRKADKLRTSPSAEGLAIGERQGLLRAVAVLDQPDTIRWGDLPKVPRAGARR